MRELGLCLSQRLLRLRAAHLGGEIGSDAAVAKELSVDVEHGLAAHRDVYRRTVRAYSPVPETAERLVRFHRGYVGAPLLRLLLAVYSQIPAPHPDELRGVSR
jgi:hypothetical protein